MSSYGSIETSIYNDYKKEILEEIKQSNVSTIEMKTYGSPALAIYCIALKKYRVVLGFGEQRRRAFHRVFKELGYAEDDRLNFIRK